MTLNQTKSLIKGILKENNKKLVSNINTNIDTKIEESVPKIENVAAFTPIGTIIAVMGNEAPANYLVCDGTIYNITDYQELAEYFETQFGSKNRFGGDGTTTFAVPDLRGEFLRGTGTNNHLIPDTEFLEGSGANVGEHQAATQITHIDGDTTTLYTHFRGSSWENLDKYADRTLNIIAGGQTQRFSVTGNAPQADVYPNSTSRPTNTSVLYCITTKNIFVNPSLNFNTDEQVVGRWIDGKPIYQKTIVDTLPVMVNTDIVAKYYLMHCAVDKFIGIKAIRIAADNNNCPFPSGMYPSGSGPTWQQIIGVPNDCTNVYDTKNSLKLACNWSAWSEQTIYITVKYTKATD